MSWKLLLLLKFKIKHVILKMKRPNFLYKVFSSKIRRFPQLVVFCGVVFGLIEGGGGGGRNQFPNFKILMKSVFIITIMYSCEFKNNEKVVNVCRVFIGKYQDFQTKLLC